MVVSPGQNDPDDAITACSDGIHLDTWTDGCLCQNDPDDAITAFSDTIHLWDDEIPPWYDEILVWE